MHKTCKACKTVKLKSILASFSSCVHYRLRGRGQSDFQGTGNTTIVNCQSPVSNLPYQLFWWIRPLVSTALVWWGCGRTNNYTTALSLSHAFRFLGMECTEMHTMLLPTSFCLLLSVNWPESDFKVWAGRAECSLPPARQTSLVSWFRFLFTATLTLCVPWLHHTFHSQHYLMCTSSVLQCRYNYPMGRAWKAGEWCNSVLL